MKRVAKKRHRSTMSGSARRRGAAARLPRLPKRPADSHKGMYGWVLVVAGSRGMIGAPALAALGAQRAGAGLVTVACPRTIQPHVATLCPCATTIPLAETEFGLIDFAAAADAFGSMGLFDPSKTPNAVAVGPGLGRQDAALDAALMTLLARFNDEAKASLVIDADALNAMHKSSAATGPGWDSGHWRRTIVTPHPGEMARLHGLTTREVKADRAGLARQTALLLAGEAADEPERCVTVLKGHHTVVSDGCSIYVNRTGNPGMATGGSGDVLTGVIAALVAQGLSCFDAARLGAHVHGLAGDLAARKLGRVSLTATDLVTFLPDAFRRLR